ncbi:MraY family glycosyltransferase [Spirochaeta thermophila]|uniref:MraY family glycosyltransferase n=1 Tax=Winmispira thermophila TaxID=154 RepID=UPI00031760E6|nr:MraY family glycosyltransferase [Spirochaeta thermophila]
MIIVPGALISLITSIALMPQVIRFSRRHKLFDPKDQRKIHTREISRLGGVGMAGALVLGLVFLGMGAEEVRLWLLDPSVLPGVVGILLMWVVGLLDDLFFLRARVKLLLQIFVASVVVLMGGYSIEAFIVPFWNIPVPFGMAGYLLSIFWIVSIVNAVNLIDGMDGLAGSVVGMATLVLAVVSILEGDMTLAAFLFVLLGAIGGFLVFNFPPAKIFMGDGGSHFLGMSLAVAPFLFDGPSITTLSLIPVILLLSVPIFDTIAAILRRTRKRISIGEPDNEHIHHKLLALGLSSRKVLLTLVSYSSLMGAISLYWRLEGGFLGMFLALAGGVGGMILFFAVSAAYHRKVG